MKPGSPLPWPGFSATPRAADACSTSPPTATGKPPHRRRSHRPRIRRADGALDGAASTAYVEQVLAKETRPGDLLIPDNLSSHKTAAVRAAFDRCGIAHLYLPAYSPDFNPIENAFSKFKRLVRGAAERTVEGLWASIGRLLDHFTPSECRNYLRHCGYHATKK